MEAKKMIERLEELATNSEVYISTIASKTNLSIKEIKLKEYGIEIIADDTDFSINEKGLEKILQNENQKFYQVSQTDYEDLPIIFIGNAKAIIQFVNDKNEGADEMIDNIDDAIDWLESEGYEVKSKLNLVERLLKGEGIFLQQ